MASILKIGDWVYLKSNPKVMIKIFSLDGDNDRIINIHNLRFENQFVTECDVEKFIDEEAGRLDSLYLLHKKSPQ